MGTAKVALLVEYDGTRYHGFQIQNDVPTIQAEIEKAILSVTGEAVRIRAAGRTDAGVHAKGQVVAFETGSKLSPEIFARALNFYLPLDISVRDARYVSMGFDPRRHATSREYRYTILNREARSPLVRRWAHQVPLRLNVEVMNVACGVLRGKRDFSPFTNGEGSRKGTVRTVYKAEVQRKGDYVFFDVEATAFLHQQVRRMVGELIKVGVGEMEIDEFYEVARSGEVCRARDLAPAHGLCLKKVNYSNIGFNYENS